MKDVAEIDRLTKRQREVLELIAKGLTNDEIGGVLGVAFTTVRSHVTAILAALEVTNRTEAAARYLALEARPEQVSVVLGRPAIAVLPLMTPGEEPRARTVAGAIARDLAGLFARSCWFPVISQVSTASARTLGATSQAIGQQLGARFLVDGALLRAGDQWRLDVQIDDTLSGHCLWTERFDFPLEALFELQGDICARVVAKAYPVLIQRVQAGLMRGTPGHDLSAWELAHRAMDLCALRAVDANTAATEHFARAAELDATLVLAHFGAGLAAYDAVLCQWGDSGLARDRIAAAAERCITIAPHHGEGYFLQGRYFQAIGEHDRVVPALEAAIAHNPSFAQAHALLAQALHVVGRCDESMTRMRHALRLGPRAFVAGLAMLHFMRFEYREALAAAEEAIVLSPRYPFARVMAAVSARQLEDHARAGEHMRRLEHDYPPFQPDGFRRLFGHQVEGVVRISTVLESMRMRA